jgi:hypothetical protein
MSAEDEIALAQAACLKAHRVLNKINDVSILCRRLGVRIGHCRGGLGWLCGGLLGWRHKGKRKAQTGEG